MCNDKRSAMFCFLRVFFFRVQPIQRSNIQLFLFRENIRATLRAVLCTALFQNGLARLTKTFQTISVWPSPVLFCWLQELEYVKVTKRERLREASEAKKELRREMERIKDEHSHRLKQLTDERDRLQKQVDNHQSASPEFSKVSSATSRAKPPHKSC